MLVQFTVKNYKCFKEEVTLSMVASNYDKGQNWDSNVVKIDKFKLNLLRSAVIYGANASGKSKLLEAMKFMRSFILSSSTDGQIDKPIETEVFKLSTESENLPSLFEIIFIHSDELYRYGFSVTNEIVISEWLYHRPKTKEIEIFYRNGQEFKLHDTKFNSSKFLIDNNSIRENALLLSVAAQFNNIIAIKIFKWFESFKVLAGLKDSGQMVLSLKKIKNNKSKVVEFIQGADFQIEDLQPIKLDLEKLPLQIASALKDFLSKNKQENKDLFSDIAIMHKKFNDLNQSVSLEKFSLNDDESAGTKKYLSLAGPLLESLETGDSICIDELDSNLHPNLVGKIVSLFNSKERNNKNAQLIFNTHNTNLFSLGLFRRDQIWFTEKDRYGASTLYSLNDFISENGDKVRNIENFELNYIKGKYGAIPYLGAYEEVLSTEKVLNNENEK